AEFLSCEWLLTFGTPPVDRRKRQTSTATPAKPGGLPLTLVQSHDDRIRRPPAIHYGDACKAGAVRLPRGLPTEVRFADRLAVDEPGEGRRAADGLQSEPSVARALLQAEVDQRAVRREGDLQRGALGRRHAFGRVLAQVAQGRGQVCGDARLEHAVRRPDGLD